MNAHCILASYEYEMDLSAYYDPGLYDERLGNINFNLDPGEEIPSNVQYYPDNDEALYEYSKCTTFELLHYLLPEMGTNSNQTKYVTPDNVDIYQGLSFARVLYNKDGYLPDYQYGPRCLHSGLLNLQENSAYLATNDKPYIQTFAYPVTHLYLAQKNQSSGRYGYNHLVYKDQLWPTFSYVNKQIDCENKLHLINVQPSEKFIYFDEYVSASSVGDPRYNTSGISECSPRILQHITFNFNISWNNDLFEDISLPSDNQSQSWNPFFILELLQQIDEKYRYSFYSSYISPISISSIEKEYYGNDNIKMWLEISIPTGKPQRGDIYDTINTHNQFPAGDYLTLNNCNYFEYNNFDFGIEDPTNDFYQERLNINGKYYPFKALITYLKILVSVFNGSDKTIYDEIYNITGIMINQNSSLSISSITHNTANMIDSNNSKYSSIGVTFRFENSNNSYSYSYSYSYNTPQNEIITATTYFYITDIFLNKPNVTPAGVTTEMYWEDNSQNDSRPWNTNNCNVSHWNISCPNNKFILCRTNFLINDIPNDSYKYLYPICLPTARMGIQLIYKNKFAYMDIHYSTYTQLYFLTNESISSQGIWPMNINLTGTHLTPGGTNGSVTIADAWTGDGTSAYYMSNYDWSSYTFNSSGIPHDLTNSSNFYTGVPFCLVYNGLQVN